MTEDILLALDYIEREKGITRTTLIQAVESALVSAARKALGLKREADIKARLDTTTGQIRFFLEGKQIDSAKFGRIAAQTAKQVIIQKIREAERDLVFDEYHEKIGEIVSGLVHRIEKGNIIVDLGKVEGIIPKREQSHTEEFRQGDRIRAYCLDVKRAGRGPQVLLSRSHPGLVKKLFEMEVPEIYEKIVEVKSVARAAGERSKIAVSSKDEKVDPVGACVGMRGNRVKNVVRELQGEKIDIVRWSKNITEFVTNALSPAELQQIMVDEQNQRIQVIVAQDQLSLAIGKKGQNVRLACKLTGWEIDIRTKEQIEAKKAISIREIEGVGPKLAKTLKDAGFDTVEKISQASEEQLLKVKGVGKKSVQKIIVGAKKLLSK